MTSLIAVELIPRWHPGAVGVNDQRRLHTGDDLPVIDDLGGAQAIRGPPRHRAVSGFEAQAGARGQREG